MNTCTFIKKRLQHKCLLVNIAKISGTAFFKEQIRWLFICKPVLTGNLRLCVLSDNRYFLYEIIVIIIIIVAIFIIVIIDLLCWVNKIFTIGKFTFNIRPYKTYNWSE